jgi:hypothetical protein
LGGLSAAGLEEHEEGEETVGAHKRIRERILKWKSGYSMDFCQLYQIYLTVDVRYYA